MNDDMYLPADAFSWLATLYRVDDTILVATGQYFRKYDGPRMYRALKRLIENRKFSSFPTIAEIKEYYDSTPAKELKPIPKTDHDSDYQKGVEQTAAYHKSFANFIKTIDQNSWELYLKVFRREFQKLCGDINLTGLDMGAFTQRYAFQCLMKANSKSSRAIEILKREML